MEEREGKVDFHGNVARPGSFRASASLKTRLVSAGGREEEEGSLWLSHSQLDLQFRRSSSFRRLAEMGSGGEVFEASLASKAEKNPVWVR